MYDLKYNNNASILIIAGSKEYYGSAILAIKAALGFVGSIYYYAPNIDTYLISLVKEVPEVNLAYDYKKVLNHVNAVLINSVIERTYIRLSEFKNLKRVIAGNALSLIKKEDLDKNALIIANKDELSYYLGGKLDKDYLLWLSNQLNSNILVKYKTDFLVNGKEVFENMIGNPGLFKKGVNDVLAGFITALAASNNIFEAAKVGIEALSKAADLCYEENSIFYAPSDIIKKLPSIMKDYIKDF